MARSVSASALQPRRPSTAYMRKASERAADVLHLQSALAARRFADFETCLLYTSDAADE